MGHSLPRSICSSPCRALSGGAVANKLVESPEKISSDPRPLLETPVVSIESTAITRHSKKGGDTKQLSSAP